MAIPIAILSASMDFAGALAHLLQLLMVFCGTGALG
jgi:hypothetical protein